MAEPVALGIKPPQAMSLGDMLNLARGAQAYQQAEQINPLALQQQQQTARTGQINLGVAEQSDLERKNIQTFMSNPKNWQNETGDVDINKINAEVTRIAPLTGRDQIEKLTTLAKSQTENTKAAQDLTQSERAIIAGPIGILARNKVQDKNVYIQELDNIQKYHPDNKRLHKLIETQKRLINQLPEGADLATAGVRVSESLLTPTEARSAFAPTSAVTGAGQVVTTKPSIAGQTPEVTYSTPQGVTPMPNIIEFGGNKFEISPPTTAGGQPILKPLGGGMAQPSQPQGGIQPNVIPPQGGGQPQSAPQGVTPTQMSLQYPVRRAGDIRPFAPNEAVDTEKGASYRNSLTTRQTDLSASRRNLDEVIKAAIQIDKEDLFSTGVLGAVTRTIKGWAGDPKYKQLSKDLANVQISNIQAQGGSMDTVAGQQLTKMANGDETYPPDVLVNIARRTYSDLTNLDMQATGAAKFAQKYGDSNLNAFKRMWSTNADSKVFEAMSVFENVKDPEKAKEEINKILGEKPKRQDYKSDSEYVNAEKSYTLQRQQFYNKYNNIKKLTATGEL